MSGDTTTTAARALSTYTCGGCAPSSAPSTSRSLAPFATSGTGSSHRRRNRRASPGNGGFSMFTPPISPQIARAQRAPAPAASCVQEEMAEQRFTFRQIRRRRRQPCQHRRERSEQANRARCRAAPKKPAASVGNRAPTHGGGVSGGVLPLRTTTTAADSRCSRRRSAGGDGGTTLFRSVRSDEDGGSPANIAASGASNQTERDARAAPKKPAASVANRAPTAADSRCSRRRSAGGDGGTTLFRSVRSDEDGGNPANIAASGASNQTERYARAAPKRPAASVANRAPTAADSRCSRRRSAGGDGGTTLFRSVR